MTTRPTMLLAVLALVGSISIARGETADPAPAAPPPAFTVWTSSGCSRSLHSTESFTTVREALNAVDRLSKNQKFVFVMNSGNGWSDAFAALKSLRDKTEAKHLRMTTYARSCRASWTPVKSEPETSLEAEPKADTPRNYVVFDVVREPQDLAISAESK